MKTLWGLLLLLLVTACAITTETNVTCWKHRLCVGDTYKYNKAPKPGGGYYVTNVQILTIKKDYCQIRHENGTETWVKCSYFENDIQPVHVRQHPSKDEKKGHKYGKGKRN